MKYVDSLKKIGIYMCSYLSQCVSLGCKKTVNIVKITFSQISLSFFGFYQLEDSGPYGPWTSSTCGGPAGDLLGGYPFTPLPQTTPKIKNIFQYLSFATLGNILSWKVTELFTFKVSVRKVLDVRTNDAASLKTLPAKFIVKLTKTSFS